MWCLGDGFEGSVKMKEERRGTVVNKGRANGVVGGGRCTDCSGCVVVGKGRGCRRDIGKEEMIWVW